jgi:hypothetical protein
MATQEEVAELRQALERFRGEFITFTASEQGRRVQLDLDLRAEMTENVRDTLDSLPDRAALSALRTEVLGLIETTRDSDAAARQVLKDAFFEYVTTVEAKFEDDVEGVRRQVVAIKGELAETKTRLSSVPQALEASAHAFMHLTRRKGFDGLITYGGGVQWKDWRFSTVRWLAQEYKPFEELLQKIERLKKEPEEPAEGALMVIGEEPMTTEQQWGCEELYALLSQKTKDGPKIIVRNLETLLASRGARA